MSDFRYPVVDPAEKTAGDNTGDKTRDGGDPPGINQIAMNTGNDTGNDVNPRTKQNTAGHYGDNPDIHQ